MAIKICLDAGHYGKYNRSPAVPEYYESDMNWKLHLLLKSELEKYGIEVITTRKDKNVDMVNYYRGYASKGCNLFISIHSNAVGDYVKESVDFVTVYHLTDDTETDVDELSKDIANRLAPVVTKVMGVTQSPMVLPRKSTKDHNKDGVLNDNYYGVLSGARFANTAGIIVEHSFHTNTRSTKWLMDDDNLKKLAVEEAKTIAKWFSDMYKKGDVDMDGNVTISDVTMLNNILASNESPTVTSDVNGDGEITISDVTELLNELSKSTTPTTPTTPTSKPESSPEESKEKEENVNTDKVISVTIHQIRNGSRGSNVKILQMLLNKLGYKGSNNNILTEDGIFGSNSEYASKAFQRANGLVDDGIVGKNTWNKLFESFN